MHIVSVMFFSQIDCLKYIMYEYILNTYFILLHMTYVAVIYCWTGDVTCLYVHLYLTHSPLVSLSFNFKNIIFFTYKSRFIFITYYV